SAWKGLRTVREEKVYQLPYHLFGVNPAVRVTDAIEHLVELLYPEIK
ncbi:MAG TPA: ABC transporter substrate-binding protein, partial [Nitrospiraceae bacterium]|nr:ABC transporter substrate-binding protein [Nitrospiraceae bacterium]